MDCHILGQAHCINSPVTLAVLAVCGMEPLASFILSVSGGPQKLSGRGTFSLPGSRLPGSRAVDAGAQGSLPGSWLEGSTASYELSLR